MKKIKSTKSALISSVLALLLCFTMLLGTTFAWFTDSVTSGNNIIKSGNLDIELEYWNGTEWTDVKDASDILTNSLWEPGVTEVAYLRVANAGSLALKYQLGVNILSEKEGINKAGVPLKLSDYIMFGVVEGVDGSSDAYTKDDAGRAAAIAAVTDAKKISAGYTKEATMVPDDELYLALVVYMPTDVNDDANHNGVTVPQIDLGITILATQFTYENDSFGDQHDKDAKYPVVYDYKVDTLDELKEAFAKGGNVILTDDIEFEKLTAIEPGADVYLNLNGKTITVDENTTSNTLIWVKEGAKLTVDGNGTIDLGSVSTMAIFAPYGELVIENGTFIRDEVTVVTNSTTGLFMGCKTTASNVTINGGYFDPGYYDENAANIEDILAGTAEFTETADDIAKRGNSKDANLVRVAVKDNISVILNHSGYGSFKVYGGTFVGANPAWGDEGCMLPTTPNYLRPWSYYQGALLDGQTFNENEIVIPEGYTITKGTTADGVPTYTVEYNK